LGKAFPELREVAQEVRATERALLVLTEDDKFVINEN
jgi:hypothetical protein